MSLKKLASLSFALALVYSISLPARAELIKNFKTDGSIEVKSFGIDNETDRNGLTDDYRSETRTRVLLGGNFDLLDDVHSRILLRKNNRVHGAASSANGSESLTTVESTVFVDNAYVKIDKIFGHADLTVGRQFYGSSDDLLIYFGLNPDDVLSVSALDMFRADSELPRGWGKVQAMYGKMADTAGTGAANDTDVSVWGLEANTDKLIPKGSLGLGYYSMVTKKNAAGLNGADNNTLNNISVKAAGDILAGIGYYAQFVQNFGENAGLNPPAAGTENENDGNAYIVGLKAGRDLGKYPVRAHADYGRGSQDFQSISAGKRFGIIWGEHSTVGPSTLNGVGGAGLSDLRVIDFGAGTTCPKSHVGIDLNWYNFSYDDPAANGNSNAGSELDLILSYKHSENVSFDVSWARLWVGDGLENTAPTATDDINRLGGNIRLKF